jgi:glucosamine-6-phosphate deaminase
MDLRVVTPERLDTEGAAIISGWLRARPRATLLPALGHSALGVYATLGGMRRDAAFDASGLTLVQLDEYAGIAADDRRSLFGWLLRDVAGPLDVPAERIIRLHGDAADAVAACRAYDAAVAAAGGVDVAVLGLGPNGHLGFNEPPSGAEAPTRLVTLAEASLDSNGRYWGGRAACPTTALTAGMDVLLAARRTLLVVSGGRKTGILRRLLSGPVEPALPASYLWTIAGVTLLADTAAWPADVPLPTSPAAATAS